MIQLFWFFFSALVLGGILYLINRASRGEGYFPTFRKAQPTSPAQSSAARAIQIGPYRVVSMLGKGGMGTVFKGVGPQGQRVAIKMIGGFGLGPKARQQEPHRIGLV